MAKKKTAKRSSRTAETSAPPTDESDRSAEESPKVQKAADAVRRAEAELEKAQRLYQTVRREATDRLKAVREKSLGDLIEGTLELVKKHPGPGVVVAAMVGFFLGRLFRR